MKTYDYDGYGMRPKYNLVNDDDVFLARMVCL